MRTAGDPIATTIGGKVRGSEIDERTLGWRGIPYAAPPVGPFRLRPPQAVQAWSGIRDATAYGAPSVQAPMPMGAMSGAPPGPPPSEDCLYLNVTAPADAVRRPVLVWLHGGGYQIGSGTDMAGDGASFARSHGLVVVTLNYRLGALGYLAVPGEQPTGAFGLHDQIAALRWVHDNIESFGGDPTQITIYGLSAGAKSVGTLLGSPLARGLFQRAASSSGGADHVATHDQAAAVTRRFLRELGTGPERLREVTAEEILGAQTAIGSGMQATWLWRPMIDGVALTSLPLEAVAAGNGAGVPLLAQHCAAEGQLFQMVSPDAAEQADHVLSDYFGPAGRDDILDAYRRARPELDENGLRIAIMTDERYALRTTRLADAQSAHAPVWRSRYDGPVTDLPPELVGRVSSLPAMHGSDGGPVWKGGTGLNGQIHDVWGTFVRNGMPSAAGLPEWPAYASGRRPTMIFAVAGSHVVDDPQSAQRLAWEGRDWPSGTWWHVDGIS